LLQNKNGFLHISLAGRRDLDRKKNENENENENEN